MSYKVFCKSWKIRTQIFITNLSTLKTRSAGDKRTSPIVPDISRRLANVVPGAVDCIPTPNSRIDLM